MSGLVGLSRSLARPLVMRSLEQNTTSGKVAVRRMAKLGYREDVPDPPKFSTNFAIAGGFIVAAYMSIYAYCHPEHILGHYPTIDPSKWTDAELGIPPDEEDIYPPGYVPLNQQ